MEMIYLDRNESQYGPAPACFDVLRSAGHGELTRYTRDYDRGIKSRVSERLAGEFGVPERSVLLGYGAELLLKMAVHRFVPRDGKLLVPDASWWYYRAIAEEVGAATAAYRVLCDGDRFRYDAAEMIAAYDEHRPSAVLIASPNNPTGNSIAPDVLHAVLEHFRDSVMIIDEAYWGYASTDNSHVARIIEEFDNVIIVRSFSKYYALAGVRMGYAIVGRRFADFAAYTTLFLGYQQIAENLVLAALDSPQYYAHIAGRIEADKAMFHSRLAGHAGVTSYRSDGNFLLFRMAPSIATALRERLAAEGITVKFFSEPHFSDHMRLSLGTTEQNARVLEAMIAAIEISNEESNEYHLAV
jgi:histidinol-phosphate aminotransferase